MSNDDHPQPKDPKAENAEANTCLALGTGVGVLGTAAAAITGAVCPLCIVVVPGLVGYGAYKKIKLKKKRKL